MKQLFLQGKGQIKVLDVPVPVRFDGSHLVATHYSLISTGTESSAVTKNSGIMGLYEKAVKQKSKLGQVKTHLLTHGLKSTLNQVNRKLNDYTAIGYSSAGVILEPDPNSTLQCGDRVACIGAGFANHSQYSAVPDNMLVKIPDNVNFHQASFGALACIAMNGIRRLDCKPGEVVLVVGLGLIGQLTVRLLKAMGYTVLGCDISNERNHYTKDIAAIPCWVPGAADGQEIVDAATNGYGVDGVVITAATSSAAPVNDAFSLCRQRGKVVIVGDVTMNLERTKMYAKELELRMACSYGPGRYDLNYELFGHDYPYGHVRWTQQRNLEYFLQLLSQKRIEVDDLISAEYEVDAATKAYKQILEEREKIFGVTIKYHDDHVKHLTPKHRIGLNDHRSELRSDLSETLRPIGVAVIGAGGYATQIHLPNLNDMPNLFKLIATSSHSGSSATFAGKRFNAKYATSDYREILEDDEVEAVIIATRHDTHAEIILNALSMGKHVFVEKPMSVTNEESYAIRKAVEASGKVLRVGFNRRFSPYMKFVKNQLTADSPLMMSCQITVPSMQEHWSQMKHQGGRYLGEAVHFIDLCNWICGQYPQTLVSTHLGPVKSENYNRVVTLKYPNGSVAQINYLDVGCKLLGKENYTILQGENTFMVDNFERVRQYASKKAKLPRKVRDPKGQYSCLQEFAHAIRHPNQDGVGANEYDGYMATMIALASNSDGHNDLADSISLTPEDI